MLKRARDGTSGNAFGASAFGNRSQVAWCESCNDYKEFELSIGHSAIEGSDVIGILLEGNCKDCDDVIFRGTSMVTVIEGDIEA